MLDVSAISYLTLISCSHLTGLPEFMHTAMYSDVGLYYFDTVPSKFRIVAMGLIATALSFG